MKGRRRLILTSYDAVGDITGSCIRDRLVDLDRIRAGSVRLQVTQVRNRQLIF